MEDDIIKLIETNFDSSLIQFATKSVQKNPKTKLLVIDNQSKSTKSDLLVNIESYFDPGDVIIVNQSGTIPSSLSGMILRTGEEIEIRLASWIGKEFTSGHNWKVISFGAGDWRQKTEERTLVSDIHEGDIVTFHNGLFLTIKKILAKPSKLMAIEFQTDISSEELWSKIYEIGKPIQYSYLENELEIWDQQTLFSGPPTSVEPPSASFQFSWKLILALIRKGVKIVPITHSAGLSSTGDKIIDSYLPFKERYEIDKEAAYQINEAINRNKRVVALGTTVVRAIESCAYDNGGKIIATNSLTDFKIHKDYDMQIITGIISGMHIPEESHMEIMLAFAPEELILDGYNEAIENNFVWHEYGDVTLIC